MAKYWNALKLLNQVAGELGLPQPSTITGLSDVQSVQLLSMLNSSGNELMLYYPWEQFRKEWVFDTLAGIGEYALPDDWNYMLDQTQWDRTDHWPIIGPKSAQEWAWLKGGLLATAPRLRYRIAGNKFLIWPVLTATSSPPTLTLAQEYITNTWVLNALGTLQDMITADADEVMYDPWLVIKYVKLKFYQLKGFDTTGVEGDFKRVFDSLTGKDVGAPILTMSPRPVSQYIGPWSVPDGSWNVGQP